MIHKKDLGVAVKLWSDMHTPNDIEIPPKKKMIDPINFQLEPKNFQDLHEIEIIII